MIEKVKGKVQVKIFVAPAPHAVLTFALTRETGRDSSSGLARTISWQTVSCPGTEKATCWRVARNYYNLYFSAVAGMYNLCWNVEVVAVFKPFPPDPSWWWYAG